MNNTAISEELWLQLLERDDQQCLNCLAEQDLMPAHYISRGRGGPDILDNLMLLCFRCHRKSHDGKLLIVKIDKHFFFKERYTNGRNIRSYK